MIVRRTGWLGLGALLALSVPSFATVIVDTETAPPLTVVDAAGPLQYDFLFTFPGLTGVNITQLVIEFQFEDDEEGNCPTECEDFALYFTDANPLGNTLLTGGVSNWALAGSNPGTITFVDLVPGDAIEDGTLASVMFSKMTDGSNDLAVSVRAETGDFRFLNATATVTFEKSGDPGGDVPEPATALLLGAGLAGFGLMRRKRVRLQ